MISYCVRVASASPHEPGVGGVEALPLALEIGDEGGDQPVHADAVRGGQVEELVEVAHLDAVSRPGTAEEQPAVEVGDLAVILRPPRADHGPPVAVEIAEVPQVLAPERFVAL